MLIPAFSGTPPTIARRRDYADYLPEGPLSESPMASPTWPWPQLSSGMSLRGSANPLTRTIFCWIGDFYDASQPGRVPNPLVSLTSHELQVLLTSSRSYRTAARYCDTLGLWRDILHQSRLFLVGIILTFPQKPSRPGWTTSLICGEGRPSFPE